MRAAVLFEAGAGGLELRDDVVALGPDQDEVRIRIRATGICHSDLSVINGELPGGGGAMVVGHEGAGEVIAVGSRVAAVAPGDHVVVNWIPACGACDDCRAGRAHLCMTFMANLFERPHFEVGGAPAFGMAGTGTWAEEVVVPWQAAIKIGHDVPFEHAALLGCGVPTGIGAVLNTGDVRPGDSVAVIGLGGVGLSAVQGARLAGATTILAVDPVEAKHVLARRFGATDTTAPEGLAAARDRLTGGRGFDHAFEAVGRSATIRAAWDVTRRGGDVIIVGAGAPGDNLEISSYELLFAARNLKPSVYGASDLRRDLPKLITLIKTGRFDVEGLISRRLRFDDLPEGVAALDKGEAVRQVVVFD
ncbi:alcohol dehydrogenase catalytic domain-containing protein [Actinomadura roseirufa]|uniref:alcohol dehydrogenase catalytic domain-containing protein n=1 Tax=Actinomadura roseirufa TaxID=2094049 RepID=UPI0010418B73|nr:alcohol dehydrogenase catalytic domain-containing protein [Actinomadura roseirufa]